MAQRPSGEVRWTKQCPCAYVCVSVCVRARTRTHTQVRQIARARV
jgi:hypothetical protein